MLWRNGGSKSAPAGVSMICEVVIRTYSTLTLGVIAQYYNCLSEICSIVCLDDWFISYLFERKARG
jgi:hypothetical protein